MTTPELTPTSHRQTTRLCIVQPIIPHYRVPVFDLLARQPGIQLEVWAGLGQKGGSLEAARPADSFHAIEAPLKRIGPFVSQPRLLEAVTNGAFDVVILSWNARHLQLGRGLRAARKRGVRSILWGHGYSKNDSWWRTRQRNRFLRIADACLTYNHSAASALIEQGYSRDRVFVALNAIDQSSIAAARELWLSSPGKLSAFQRAHELVTPAGHRRPHLILFVSRLEPDKRVDLLLEAFAHVVKQRPAARLAIIGRGPEQPRLEAIAQALGIADSVRFTGAIYDENMLAPWFLSAAVFAYPVAIGLSILHAFGYGAPVVTSDDIPSHNPEIEALRPNENGLLYREGDTRHFADTMLALLENPSQLEYLSSAARATVAGENGFTIDRMVRGFVDAVNAVRSR